MNRKYYSVAFDCMCWLFGMVGIVAFLSDNLTITHESFQFICGVLLIISALRKEISKHFELIKAVLDVLLPIAGLIGIIAFCFIV